jgi:bioY protein
VQKAQRRGEKKMKYLDIRNMALIAVMTALMCIFGPMSIPIGAVPISLTPLLVYLSAYVLGMKSGTVAYLVYLLIGFVGVPVMSGYSGGPAKILGPTGGYLLAFILMALMTGFAVDHFYKNVPLQAVVMLLALVLCYAAGTAWFVGQTKMAWGKALTVCVFPFIPLDCVKLFLAILVGRPVRERLHVFLQDRRSGSLA